MSAAYDDVIVVGAGPAGTIAALVLARGGARVRLIDRARFPRPKLCGDSLNPGALATLARVVDLAPLVALGQPVHGMRISGVGGATVCGRYPAGVAGLSIPRLTLDAWLVAEACRAGVVFDDGLAVRGVSQGADGATGVTVSTGGGQRHLPARLVIGADGRGSVVARQFGLAHVPRRPRRWAMGAYAEGVAGMDPHLGEMHVRAGRYLGLAPVAGGLTNVCLVVSYEQARAQVRAPWASIRAAMTGDPLLGDRFERAVPVTAPVVLGPLAVDVTAPGQRGVLLAGDAAGFIDPMTGDGMRLALAGGLEAAHVAGEVLAGRLDRDRAVAELERRRQVAFAGKWRFNRSLRALVGFDHALSAATLAARAWPAPFEAVVRFAADVHVAA